MYFAHFLLTRVPIFHAAVTPVPLGDEVQRQWVIIQKMRSGFDQKLPQTSSILNPASGASAALCPMDADYMNTMALEWEGNERYGTGWLKDDRFSYTETIICNANKLKSHCILQRERKFYGYDELINPHQ